MFNDDRLPILWVGETFNVDSANSSSKHASRRTIVIVVNGVSIYAMRQCMIAVVAMRNSRIGSAADQ